MRWRVLEGCSSPATAAADLCKTSARIKASRRPTYGASRFSLQLIQASGFGERPPAARAIAAGVEPLGAAQGCRKGRLRPLVGALHRARGRLVTELGADGLPCRGPRTGTVAGLAQGPAECRTGRGAGAGRARAKP